MSTKIAVIIGDYSNGWNDAIIVQNVMKIKNQEQLREDRAFVQGVMTDAMIQVIEQIEANPKTNPIPQDEPCCDNFEKWAKSQDVAEMPTLKSCPCCGREISKERREKYLSH